MAANIKVKLTGFKIFQDQLARIADTQRARKDLHNRLTKIWRDAAEAFIRAAVSNILVESGMSAASFLPLSRAIKRLELEPFIIDKANSPTGLSPNLNRKKHALFPSGNRRAPPPSQALGEQQGERGYVFSTGTPESFLFRFNFRTSVFQHAFHEATQKTLELGRAAFLESVSISRRPALLAVIESWFHSNASIESVISS